MQPILAVTDLAVGEHEVLDVLRTDESFTQLSCSRAAAAWLVAPYAALLHAPQQLLRPRSSTIWP